MNADPNDFDLSAAWLRRARSDTRAFTEALATRLEAALPDAVEVDRRRDGLFSRTTHVARIAVRGQDSLLALEIEQGRFRAVRARVVRGVTIGSEEITVPAWLEEVLRRTRALGDEAGEAHGALHAFLMS